MSCECGCGGLGAACAEWGGAVRIGAACDSWQGAVRIGAPRAARSSRLRQRVRTIGQSDGSGEVDFSATLQSYVQEGLQDYQTARTAFNAANQALQVLQSKSQAQWKATQAAMETYVTVLTTAVGAPWIGALFNSWFSQQPGAAAGPGTCVTNPPAGSDWPTLKQWQFYKPWGYPFGSDYAVPAPGSFEAFAQIQLEYNKVLSNNCFDTKAQDRAALLAHLVDVWNANHQGPTRQICRKGLNPSGWNDIPLWDPIADALWWGLNKKYPCDTAFCTNPNEPVNATVCFTINDGPLKQPKVVTLRLPPAHPLATPSTSAAQAASPPSSAAPGATAAALAGAGLLAAGGLYVYLRGLPPALARLIR